MSTKSPASDELRDPPKLSLAARAISADARALVKRLHDKVLAQYAAMPKRSYNRQAARGKLPRLIGAMIGELLHVRTTNQTLGWMSLSVRHPYLSTFGYAWRSFANLLDALQGEGLIELLRGYYPALGLSMPGRSKGRSARIRASAKLIALCAEYSITLDNISDHFKIQRTKKPRTKPGPLKHSSLSVLGDHRAAEAVVDPGGEHVDVLPDTIGCR
jgi:hypothetical protein